MGHFDDLIEKIRNEAQAILSPGGTFSIDPCGDGEKNVEDTVRVEITALDGKNEVRTLTCSEVANLVALAKTYSEAVGEAAG
jgi:hypothetical protein|tara:strand:- start:934 stop:1179 length:246 start_codon:yes stop_codon:yes gene_type:complete